MANFSLLQVRALTELLPMIDVAEGDPFNSSPTDPKLMGPDALARFRAGEKLPASQMRTPLVELPLGATEDRICGTIDIEKALTEGGEKSRRPAWGVCVAEAVSANASAHRPQPKVYHAIVQGPPPRPSKAWCA